MTDQERVEAHLRKHRDAFLCASCIAREVDLSPAAAREIAWTLHGLPGYQMRGAKCLNCLRGKRSIRYVGDYNVAGAPGHVALFLLTNKGIHLCDACLAFGTELSLADTQRALTAMATLFEFERRTGDCTVCARYAMITAALPEDDIDRRARKHSLTATVPYRGWRIDLLSYGTSGGWRPFVLIKGRVGAEAGDAPSIVSEVFPSKTEADHKALEVAKGWIDERDSSGGGAPVI